MHSTRRRPDPYGLRAFPQVRQLQQPAEPALPEPVARTKRYAFVLFLLAALTYLAFGCSAKPAQYKPRTSYRAELAQPTTYKHLN